MYNIWCLTYWWISPGGESINCNLTLPKWYGLSTLLCAQVFTTPTAEPYISLTVNYMSNSCSWLESNLFQKTKWARILHVNKADSSSIGTRWWESKVCNHRFGFGALLVSSLFPALCHLYLNVSLFSMYEHSHWPRQWSLGTIWFVAHSCKL